MSKPIDQELLPCPFCGCKVGLVTGFEYHTVRGDHSLKCPFMDDEPIASAEEWNTRAAVQPAGVAVQDENDQLDFVMSIEEKRRAGFEAWFQAEMLPRINGSQAIVRAMCEKGWNAALDSVVIELPKKVEAPWSNSYDAGISATAKCIEAAGLKVKP